jgi:hypothetical protein
MKSIKSLLAAASLTAILGLQAQETIRLQPAGFDQGQFHLRVSAQSGGTYRVEVSSNLVDWAELTTVTAPSELFEVSDGALAGFEQKFYRARQIVLGPAGLRAAETNLFSGDGTVLLVEAFSAAGWIFTVDGSETGSEQSGWIVTNPAGPAQAFYTAPNVTAPRNVTICARDRGDPGRQFCVTLRVSPIAGTLVVRPAAVTLGVGGRQQFLAAVEVPGVGLVPLNRALWKVNGAFGGTLEHGAIDLTGEYQAPARLPASLPAAIEVGFSFGIDSAVLARANVTVAALKLAPEKLVFTDNGQEARVTATLLKSDGSAAVQPDGAVTFGSGSESVARVDQTGLVAAGTNTGTTFIRAQHNTFPIADYAAVEGRKQARVLLLEAEPRSSDRLAIYKPAFSAVRTVAEVEATAPRAIFSVKPDVYFYRGAFSVFTDSVAGVGNKFVRIEGDGVNTISYDPDDRIAQPSGVVATIDRKHGLVTIGDKPGTGEVRFTYDDGYVRHSSTALVSFTRLKLDVRLQPATSPTTNEAYINEWLNFFVEVSNPRPNSVFIGDTPIRVRRADGRPFFVATRLEAKTEGLTLLPRPLQVRETSEILLQIPGGEGSFDPDFGKLEFSISSRNAGPARFIVSVPNDPGIPPREFEVNLKQPRLRIKKSIAPPLVRGLPGYGAIAGSKVAVHSYVDIEQFEGPALEAFSTLPNQFLPHRDHDLLLWTIQRPDGTTEQVVEPSTVGDQNRFARNFHQTGTYRVTLGYERRPELSTEPLEVEVIGPGETGTFAEVAAAPKKEVRTDNLVVPLQNQLAGLRILSPVSDLPWLDGTPMTISARTYDGLGQPRVVGKKIREIVENSSGQQTETVSYQIAGFWVAYLSGPANFTPFDVRRIVPAYPDANGIATAQFTPEGNDLADTGRDLVVALLPALFTLREDQYSTTLALPEQVKLTRNGMVVRDDKIPLGLVSYSNPADQGLLDQAIVFGGSGAVLVPRYLPVATERVRQAIAEGVLPADSDLVTFRMRGRAGFVASLQAGLPALDFQGRADLVSAERNGDEAVFRIRTRLPVFATNENLYGQVTLPVTLGNQARVRVLAEFVGYRVRTNTVDYNLPLNAAYSFRSFTFSGSQFWDRHEDGVLPLSIATPSFRVPYRNLDVELRPSLHACWDRNRNGIADPEEDLDGDGLFTVADATNAVPYRGAFPDQPLVGFSRKANPVTGELDVRDFRRTLSGGFPEFYVYGNTSDKRWLDRRRMVLSEEEMPDGIPDFASPAPNAESILLRTDGGNLADYFTFTAYNVVAEVMQNLPETELDFAAVGGEIERAYDAYGTFDSAQTLQNAALAPRTRNPVSVYVDHEARPSDFHAEEPNVLIGFVPFTFYAGVLDQFYQRGLRGGGFGNVTQPYRLGQDGRVHGLDSRARAGGPTQQERRYFGLDLDGVLYDAISLNLAVERPTWAWNPAVQAQYVVYLAGLNALTNRLDEDPNSPVLRNIPVVRQVLGARTNLTAQGLVRGIGGSSGGYADLTRHTPGSFLVESKTPGAELPGLHAGYLIDGRPEQVVDPRTGMVEDDIRDVILKRNPATGALVQEERPLGLKQPRPVHGFAFNEDYKAPIRTGLKVTSKYAVRTDPQGFVPSFPEAFKFRAWVALRELPQHPADESLLTVTTQSDGHEQVLKLAVDTLVDVAADLTAGAAMAVMTEGAYISCGGVNLQDTALNAVINFSIGLMDTDTIPGGRSFKTPLSFLNKTFNTGLAFSDLKPLIDIPIPGVKIPGLSKLEFNAPPEKQYTLKQRVMTPNYRLYNVPGHHIVPFCALLTEPVSSLKSAIKDTYSAELFNGLGSATAFGMKALSICIPREAQVGSNGLYSATFIVSRELEIQPKEPDFKELGGLPFEHVFGSYPFADEMSDEEFFRILRDKAENAGTPQTRAEAAAILDQLMGGSVLRLPRTSLYQPYKLRAMSLPGIAAAVAPGQQINTTHPFGDFVLTPGRTIIPVASVGVAMASRSNENAGGRATVTSPGYEMVLLGGVIRRASSF